MPGHSEIDLAYLTGFIDGEGFIAINSSWPRKCRDRHYNLRVGAINTKREILDWIKVEFGGYVYQRKVKDVKKHKIAYAWYLDAKKAEELLKDVYPYLKVKRLQAEVAMRFRKTFESHHNQHNYFLIFPERMAIREELQSLNRRGPCQNIENIPPS